MGPFMMMTEIKGWVGAWMFLALTGYAAILPVDSEKAAFEIPSAGKPEEYTAATDVPSGSAIAFDRKNRPYMVNAVDPECYGYISVLDEDGRWERRDFTAALKAAGFPVESPTLRTVQNRAVLGFDRQDRLYALVPTPRKVKDGVDINGDMALLYSTDYGEHFQAYRVGIRPYQGTMESSSSGRIPNGPPAVFRGVHLQRLSGKGITYPDVGEQSLDFCSLNRLDVVLPEITDEGLRLPPAVVVTERANGVTSHSGGGHIAARTDTRLFVAYVAVPENPACGGNPTYVAEVDLERRKVAGRKLVANATPLVSDSHACPTLALTSTGELDLVTGSHGWSPKHPGFLFARSIRPAELSEWTVPERLGVGESYVDMVVDSRDNLYIAYRVHPQLWIRKYDRESGKWLLPVRLLEYTPARRADGTLSYTVFYHHLFIDRRDNLYVKALFHDFDTGLKGRFPLMWLVSSDGGISWRIPDTAWMRNNRMP